MDYGIRRKKPVAYANNVCFAVLCYLYSVISVFYTTHLRRINIQYVGVSLRGVSNACILYFFSVVLP